MRDTALLALLQLLTAVAGRQQQEAADGISSSALPGSATAALSAPEAQPAAAALAFFLPGIAVGLCKALLLAAASHGIAGAAPTGPAASSSAAVTAIRALVVLLVACLGNAAVEAALHGAGPGARGGSSTGTRSGDAWSMGGAGGDVEMTDAEAAAGAASDSSESLQQALQQLQQLAQRAKAGGNGVAPASSSPSPQQQPPPPQQQQPLQPGSRMRVERSSDWVLDTAERLHQLLSTALPPLTAHQRPAVREALAQGETVVNPRCFS